jgi:hypothetical protein
VIHDGWVVDGEALAVFAGASPIAPPAAETRAGVGSGARA